MQPFKIFFFKYPSGFLLYHVYNEDDDPDLLDSVHQLMFVKAPESLPNEVNLSK